MKRAPFVLLLAAATPAVAQQAAAQQAATPGAPRLPRYNGPGIVSKNAPVNGVLTLFGNERCPTDNDGNEIVVCVRRGAAEQYRVPKELREFQVTPENQSWAAKAQASLGGGDVGVNSVGSCSASGAGGQAGCFAQAARAAKAENRAKQADEARIP